MTSLNGVGRIVHPVRWALLGAIVFLAAGMVSLNWVTVGTFGDDAVLLSLGNDLVQNGTYRITCLPGAPLCGKYPPLFPLLLGTAQAFLPPFPDGLPWLKIVNLLIASAGVFLAVVWAFRHFAITGMPPLLQCAAAVLIVSNANVLFLATELMSESLFMTLVFAGLLCAETSTGEPHADRRRIAGLVVCCVIAVYTRTIAAAFAAAALAWLAVSGRRRAAAWGAAACVTAVVPWLLWSRVWVPAHEPLGAVFPYFVSYDYHARALREFLFDGTEPAWLRCVVFMHGNISGLLDAMGTLMAPDIPAPGAAAPAIATRLFAWAVAIPVAVGMHRAIAARSLAGVFMAVYTAVVLFWPWSNKLRFMVPVAPVLSVFFAAGMARLFALVHARKIYLPAMAVLAGAVLNAGLSLQVNLLSGSLAIRAWGPARDNVPGHDALMAAAGVIRRGTTPETILMTDDRGFFHALHTQRAAVPIEAVTLSPGRLLEAGYGRAPSLPWYACLPDADAVLRDAWPQRPHLAVGVVRKSALHALPPLLRDTAVMCADSEESHEILLISPFPPRPREPAVRKANRLDQAAAMP